MATIKDIRCDNWQDFKSRYLSVLYDDGNFARDWHIFRGQRTDSWKLESSFDRWLIKTTTTENRQRASIYKHLIDLFKEQFYSLDPKEETNDEIHIMALAQHYGLPTRLLDWTESPYIAAFFAFSDAAMENALEHDCAIWSLDTRSNIWGREHGVEIVKLPQKRDVRLKNQSGVFTLLLSQHNCLEEYVDGCNSEEIGLYRFLIPAMESWRALSDLEAMGINHTKLFPGIEGCAVSAKLMLMSELAHLSSWYQR